MESGASGKVLAYQDEVARCLIYPRFNNLDGAFAGERCYSFNQPKGAGKRSDYILSVGYTGLLKSVSGIHKYGCRTAVNANKGIADRKAEKRLDFDKEKDSVCYIGCYILDINDLKAVNSDFYDIDVVAHPELGEDAHYHLCLKIKDGVPAETRAEREDLSDKRLDIIREIHKISFGPLRHVCQIDIDREDELSKIHVPSTRSINISETNTDL